jgi:CBS domain containing-hemolysin-like protein
VARPALFASENLRGHQLLDQLISQHQHLAVILDDAGHMTGIVTLEDVLEYLLGASIVGEHDAHPEMQHLARERARFHADDDLRGSDLPDRH